MADLISLADAQGRVRAAAGTLVDLESVPIADALGRRLAQDYHADVPWPATDRSAMDGYGVRAGAGGMPAGTTLDVIGVCNAGHPFESTVADGQAIRIMTGAVVPASVDAVVPVENTSGYVEVGERVTIESETSKGANIRPIGSEVAVGDRLLAGGSRLRSAHIGALAVLGIATVPVFRRPRVAILATGDEVVDIERVPAPHQVRNSNAHALAAQVRAAGGEPHILGIAADDEASLRGLLETGFSSADVLLTIGGVSKGTHDLVHGMFQEMGVKEYFHGVKLKPGKPVFFGVRDASAAAGGLPVPSFVFGLPGNPASTFTVFDLLVRPLLAWIAGGSEYEETRLFARVAGQPFKKNWREQAVPAALRSDSDGSLIAELGSSKPSGDPFSLVPGQAYALIPADTAPSPGLVVPVVFYSDLA